METATIQNPSNNNILLNSHPVSSSKPFIEANTLENTFEEVKKNHIIPVFIKDNEPLISHIDFVEATQEVTASIFAGEAILKPTIRLSHPVKGRVPEAKDKPANLLMEHEKTIYYQRMAFVIELPDISHIIDGETLCLTVGGVKAYNLDNLSNKQGADQYFKVFVGFKVKVCTNLCVWTDGYMGDLKVKSLGQLKACIYSLLNKYNANYHLHALNSLVGHSITEQQFAQIVGRARIYHHLPIQLKTGIPELAFGDSQLNTVCKDYFRDSSFCRMEDGSINLWRLYNLFTEANKSTYIDNFLDRSVNAFQFVEEIKFGLENKNACWYLN